MKQVWPGRPIYVDDVVGGDIISVRWADGTTSEVAPTLEHFPGEVQGAVRRIEIGGGLPALDVSVVRMVRPCTTAAVYTRNLCVSPAVTFDRANTARGLIQLVCVVSKNASVFTPTGQRDIERLAGMLAEEFDVDPGEILISCTGVIGRQLPIDEILPNLMGLSAKLSEKNVDAVSRAIMTTDKRPKCASIRVGDVVIGGYAKGAGMIEPNMATMLVYLFTNADLAKPELDRALKRAVDPTFNALSVDSDTSTSDTVALVSTGRARAPHDGDFELALRAVCLKLAHAIAREAEGSTKLLEVTVGLSTSEADAYFFAKKIVNSPLVKTAIHGADPNWGRIVMAIGKPVAGSPLLSIDPSAVTIAIQGRTLYSCGEKLDLDLAELSRAIKSAFRVTIDVAIGNPVHTATVWGCDLSAEYVHENAHYTS